MRAILYDAIAKVELTKDELPELIRSIRREDLTYHGNEGQTLVFIVKNPESYLHLDFMIQAQADRDLQASF